MTTKKILCLHGGASNSDITTFQTMGLQLPKRMECIYIDAPHVIDGCYPGLDAFSSGPFRGWAGPTTKSLSSKAAATVSTSAGIKADHWDESLEFIAKFCADNGPFDGVYGFSQGAAIVTNFSHPQIWRDRFHMTDCPWKFAILACGGAINHITISKYNGGTIDIPSFHIHGKKDHLLSESREMTAYYNNSRMVVHSHERGHEIDMRMFAREKDLMAKLDSFLDANLSAMDESGTCLEGCLCA